MDRSPPGGSEPPFVHRQRVRYHEIDAQYHAYASRYLEFVDAALIEFVRHLGWDYQEAVAIGFDPALVRAEIDFKRGARFDEVIEIAVRPLRLGRTSCVFEFQVDGPDGVRVAEVVLVYVNFDAGTRAACEIPAVVRSRLEPLLPAEGG